MPFRASADTTEAWGLPATVSPGEGAPAPSYCEARSSIPLAFQKRGRITWVARRPGQAGQMPMIPPSSPGNTESREGRPRSLSAQTGRRRSNVILPQELSTAPSANAPICAKGAAWELTASRFAMAAFQMEEFCAGRGDHIRGGLSHKKDAPGERTAASRHPKGTRELVRAAQTVLRPGLDTAGLH